MEKIGVFIEQRKGQLVNVGLELVSEVKRLNPDYYVEAILLIAKRDEGLVSLIEEVGADSVIVLENKAFDEYDTHYYSEALITTIKRESYSIFLVGSTLIGRDLAPRVSAILHTGLTADATILSFEEIDGQLSLLATRPALGGNLFATIVCPNHRPQMATIRPGVFKAQPHKSKTICIVKTDSFHFSSLSKVRIIEHKPVKEKSVDLTQAKLIISGGRGVIKQLNLIKDIAELTGGEAAASRAIVDTGLQTRSRLVGQTGSTVQPFVYVAFGISGAIQHVAGMEKSEMIIAVNNDPKAPIFDVATVSIVGDAQKILPEIVKILQE